MLTIWYIIKHEPILLPALGYAIGTLIFQFVDWRNRRKGAKIWKEYERRAGIIPPKKRGK